MTSSFEFPKQEKRITAVLTLLEGEEDLIKSGTGPIVLKQRAGAIPGQEGDLLRLWGAETQYLARVVSQAWPNSPDGEWNQYHSADEDRCDYTVEIIDSKPIERPTNPDSAAL